MKEVENEGTVAVIRCN